MYSLPSTSQIFAPSPRATKNGAPPTLRNARTGELTPPGMRSCARVKSSDDREFKKKRSTFNVQRSTFNAQRSTLNVQRSTFNAQRSTFNAQRSTFNVQRSNRRSCRGFRRGERRWIYGRRLIQAPLQRYCSLSHIGGVAKW